MKIQLRGLSTGAGQKPYYVHSAFIGGSTTDANFGRPHYKRCVDALIDLMLVLFKIYSIKEDGSKKGVNTAPSKIFHFCSEKVNSSYF